MANIDTTTSYTVKETGERINVPYTYQDFGGDFEGAVESFGGEAKACSVLQQVEKENAGNTARERAKVENGHSARIPLTEAQKAEAKLKRGKQKDALAILGGLSAEKLEELGITL